LGRSRKTISKELLELLVHRKLSSLMFFGIVGLDALGAVFPEYLNRKITMFVPFPLLFVLYLLNAEKLNKLFLAALVFNLMGVYNFNNPYGLYNPTGLIYHTVAYLLYSIVLLQKIKTVRLNKVLKLATVLILFVAIPLKLWYYEGIKDVFFFNETLLYIISGTLYVFLAILTYMTHKTVTGRFLLFSAISILLGSYFQGYNLFINKNDLLNFFAVVSFNLTHYLLCCYLVTSEAETIGRNS